MNHVKRDITLRTKTRSNGTTTVIASTPNPDRYDDVVSSDWLLESYMENPVVQFGHDYSTPPVGKTEKLSVDPDTGNLMATIKWDDAPTNPLAQTVAAQFRNGFLRAVSVGFQPSQTTPRNKLDADHPAYGEKGMFFTGNKLLEISAVPVPANAESLALRAMGLSQAKSIINVEETDDTYIVTYQKYPAAGGEEEEEEPEEEEEEAFGDEDEDEEEEEEEEAFGEDEEDEEDDEEEEKETRPEPYDDEEEDEEEKALTARVRRAILHLLGHDPDIRSALTGPRRRKSVKRSHDSLTDLFGC